MDIQKLEMVVDSPEDIKEGALNGVPAGLHRITVPLNSIGWIDTKGGNITLGGSITESTPQIITEGSTVDGVTFTSIKIIKE
jgi:hypothetical protein